MNKQKIILASQSPRRKILLKNITENFETIPSNFDEIWDENKNLEKNILFF
jgi:predicted house-cleaning NTP pyrophosphatase (Maf/HAM1 superfamily)